MIMVSWDRDLTEQEIKIIMKKEKFAIVEQLYSIMGYPAIVLFLKDFGGDSIYIPDYVGIQRERQKQDIYDAYLKGNSCKDLARKYKVCTRTIQNIVNEFKNLIESG